MAPTSDEPSSASSPPLASNATHWRWFAFISILIALAARLVQHDLIWVEEGYGIAAAAELLKGKRLYADIWFDKPPLYAYFYVLCGGAGGWPLRILNSAHLLAIAGSVWWAGRSLWGAREGWLASALCSLSLTFWIPSAVMAVAPDLLMVVPHVMAVAFASRGKAGLSGLVSGAALLCNSRGLFVVAASALWTRRWIRLLSCFAAVQVAASVAIPWRAYWSQVWEWGFVYSAQSFIENPVIEGIRRTGNWAWFHLALVTGTLAALWRDRDWRPAFWILLCLAAVAAGWRFFPRYYFHLLPAASLIGARGILSVKARWRVALLALLLIPVVRFGPRYVLLAVRGSADWSDTAMMSDSRHVARQLKSWASSQPTLLVWGYRPDIFVFSGIPAGTRFLDSQPLTGVLADRHLTNSQVLYPDLAARNRAEITQTAPEFVVDGLGPLNPALAIATFPDLRAWLHRYEAVDRTRMSIVYRLRPDSRPGSQEAFSRDMVK